MNMKRPIECKLCGSPTANLSGKCLDCLNNPPRSRITLYDPAHAKSRVLVEPVTPLAFRCRAGGGYRVAGKRCGE